MRNSNKNGLLKSMTTMLLVILALALTLTGCSDNDARDAAKTALAAAEAAQEAADKANLAASNAQNSANDAQQDADANKNIIDALPDDEAVAAAVKQILEDYVNGAGLVEDSIVTMESLGEFLHTEAVTNLLSNYATVSSLESYAKDSDLAALAAALEAEKNNLIKEMQNYVSASALEAYRAELTNQLAVLEGGIDVKIENAVKDMTTALANVTAEINAAMGTVDSKISKALFDYCTREEVAAIVEEVDAVGVYLRANGFASFDALIESLNSYADNAVEEYKLAYDAATETIVLLVADLNELLANKSAYSEAEYLELVSIIDTAKIRIMRAQTAEDAQTLYNAVAEEIAANVADLKTELAAAIADVDTVLLPIASIYDGYLSREQIAACRAIVDQCDAATLAEVADLVAQVEALEAEYQNLLDAKEAAAPVIDVIFAIPAYDNLPADDAEFSAAFEAATAAYTEWVATYFDADAADTVNKQNIQRILCDAYDYYYGAELKING